MASRRHGESGHHHRCRHPPGPRVGRRRVAHASAASRSPRARGRAAPERRGRTCARCGTVRARRRAPRSTGGRERAGQAAAAGRQREHSDQEGDHEGTPVRQASEHSPTRPARPRSRWRRAGRTRGQREAGSPARAGAGVEEGDPVAGAAQRREPADLVGRCRADSMKSRNGERRSRAAAAAPATTGRPARRGLPQRRQVTGPAAPGSVPVTRASSSRREAPGRPTPGSRSGHPCRDRGRGPQERRATRR